MIKIYTTIMPVILGGIANMLFTKTNLYKNNAHPMDNNLKYKDNEPILGKNKTWIGFVFMIVLTSIMQLLWGFICNYFNLNSFNDFYNINENTPVYNIILGAVLGFVYVLFELPNSFIKRRFKITPGKTENSYIGKIFFLIDQFDSIIGIGILMYFITDISVFNTIFYIFTGGFTHLAVNMILFTLKIRKNL